MTTPNRTPIQYPSQSADYISLENGGPHRNSLKIQQQHYKGYSPYYRKPQFPSNRNVFHDKRKHVNTNPKKTEEFDFSSYFHPSMLKDPWIHLINQQTQKKMGSQ